MMRIFKRSNSNLFLVLTVWFCICSLSANDGYCDEASAALLKYREPIDKSIDRGLEYLAKSQKKDGLFPGRHGKTTAIAALTGMAFLAKGNTPGLGPYGENINRCIDLVLKSEQTKGREKKPTGYLVRSGEGKMYAHCISTLFLSEVSGMVDPERQKKIDEVLPRALSLILDAQDYKKRSKELQGGWRYQPNSNDADLSLTGWAVMALRSAKLNGAAVPDDSIAKAVEFILRCRPRKSEGEKGFSYMPYQGGKPAMTGVAILCLSLSGQFDHPSLPKAGDYLLKAKPNKRWGGGGHFYYMNYYCTQAMFQLGGKYWDQWAEQLYEAALKRQKPKDGSWGDPYSTAMTVLALTVSYRQLPVYQR